MTHSLPGVFVIFLELTTIGPVPCVPGVVGANPVEESDCCLWQFMIVILIWRCWPCVLLALQTHSKQAFWHAKVIQSLFE
jgi:hypothetical protein